MTLRRLPCSGASRVMAGLGPATHDFPVGYTGILDVRPALAMTWGGASGSIFQSVGITARSTAINHRAHPSQAFRPRYQASKRLTHVP